LDGQIAAVSAQVEQRPRPFETAVALLDTLPGVGRRTAEILIAAGDAAEALRVGEAPGEVGRPRAQQ
jgi:transposase